MDVAKPQHRREGRVVGHDAGEDRAVVTDQIHLVDGDDHVPDAEEAGDEAVAPRLREDAGAGVDEDDRQVCRGGARRHVAGVLLVAGRVGDGELALLGGEVPLQATSMVIPCSRSEMSPSTRRLVVDRRRRPEKKLFFAESLWRGDELVVP